MALLALGAIYLLGVNRVLFVPLNELSLVTGASLWAHITVLGDTLVLLTLLLPLVYRFPRLVWAALFAAIVALLASHGLKELLDVARPARVLGEDGIQVIGRVLRRGAFPSGHTTAAFTIAGVLTFGLRSRVVLVGAIAAATLVGLSRIVVGAHWPADVAGGAVVGWLSAAAGSWLAARSRWTLTGPARLAAGVFLGAGALWLLDYDTGYPRARAFQQLIAVAALAAVLTDFLWMRRRGKTGSRTG